MSYRPLNVAIFAQITPAAGGTAQALLQLVSGLGRLEGDEQYALVTSPESAEWLQPHIGSNTRLAVSSAHLSYTGPVWQRHIASLLKARARPLLPLVDVVWRRALRPMQSRRASMLAPPVSDGFIESLGAQVVHFPYQRFIRTALPSIFEPWDLQHIHLPRFFDRTEWLARDVMYREACRAATVVVAASQWSRSDVVEQYAIAPEKVLVIPRGSTLATGSTGKSGYGVPSFRLPSAFALYPAQMLPHKNHLRLLDAIALLRDRYRARIDLVCSGALGAHFQLVRQHAECLGIDDQVTFTGHVSDDDLSYLYRHARLLVFPTLFEGYGFPLIEAMTVGLPVVCSNVTCLPEVAGGAAVLFDPNCSESIAAAIWDVWRNTAELDRLSTAGIQRARLFDPLVTAQRFRDLYREFSNRVER